MIQKKIVVPEGMLKVAMDATRGFTGYGYDSYSDIPTSGHIGNHATFAVALEAALRWLCENPIHPSPEQWQRLFSAWNARIDASETLADSPHPIEDQLRFTVIEWQRRMFLAPEPEIPDEIEDLLPFPPDVVIPGDDLYRQVKAHLDNVATEAFRRGQKAGPR